MGRMSSPWLESKTPVAPPSAANPTVRQLLYAGVVTGAWSGLICLVIYLIGRIAGVTFEFVGLTSNSLLQVPWIIVLVLPLAAGVVGALLASLVRGVRHAGRIVFWLGTLVAVASGLGPLTQPAQVGWSTRILLVLMHLVTWFLVVPQIARIVGDSEPGASVDRGD